MSDQVIRAILLYAKGILRDQKMRRNVMMYVICAAGMMAVLGYFLLAYHRGWAREHLFLLTVYWLGFFWLLITGLLLAIFDILLLRTTARRMKRHLEEDMLREAEEKKKSG